jgi:hypothetical protein
VKDVSEQYDLDELLPVPAFARLAHLSPREAYCRIGRGEIPSVKIGERGLRVPRRVLRDLVEQALSGTAR